MAEKKVRAAGYRPGAAPARSVHDRRSGRCCTPARCRTSTSRRGASASSARSSRRSSSPGSSSTSCRARARRRTSTASPAGAASTRSSRASTGASSRSSAGRCRPRRFAIAHAEHGFTANVPLRVARGRRRAARDPRRRRAADARPRLAAAPRRARQVLLEERQVAARDRALRRSTSPASGSATATTTTPTPGRKSRLRRPRSQRIGAFDARTGAARADTSNDDSDADGPISSTQPHPIRASRAPATTPITASGTELPRPSPVTRKTETGLRRPTAPERRCGSAPSLGPLQVAASTAVPPSATRKGPWGNSFPRALHHPGHVGHAGAGAAPCPSPAPRRRSPRW